LPTGAKATVIEDGIKIELADGTSFSAKGVVEDLLGNFNFSQLAETSGVTGLFRASDARLALRAAVDLETLTDEQATRYDINNDG
jgi:hypothetical protein